MKIDNPLDVVMRFRQLCEESVDTGEFTEEAYDEIRKGCDELINSDQYAHWGAELILMIEDYDDRVDLSAGYPGDFGHALESGGLEASSKLYIESINRKPTGLVVGLADRVHRSHGEIYGIGAELFESVLTHSGANTSSKEIAEMVLEEQ